MPEVETNDEENVEENVEETEETVEEIFSAFSNMATNPDGSPIASGSSLNAAVTTDVNLAGDAASGRTMNRNFPQVSGMPSLIQNGDLVALQATRDMQEALRMARTSRSLMNIEDFDATTMPDGVEKTAILAAQRTLKDKETARKTASDEMAAKHEELKKIMTDEAAERLKLLEIMRKAAYATSAGRLRELIMSNSADLSDSEPTLDQMNLYTARFTGTSEDRKQDNSFYTMKPQLKVRPFNGEDDYCWTEYLQRVETIVTQNRFDEAGAKRLVTSNLEGDAARRFAARPSLQLLPYAKLMKGLNELFGMSHQQVMHALTAVRQGPNESVDSYAARVWMLIQPIIPSMPPAIRVISDRTATNQTTDGIFANPRLYEEQAVYYGELKAAERGVLMWFKNGLREEILYKMPARDYSGFEDCREEAIRCERALLENGMLTNTLMMNHIGLAAYGGEKDGSKITSQLVAQMHKAGSEKYHKKRENTVSLMSNSRVLQAMDRQGKASFPNGSSRGARNQHQRSCYDCHSTEHTRGPKCPKFRPEWVRDWDQYGFTSLQDYYSKTGGGRQNYASASRGSRGTMRGNYRGNSRGNSRGQGNFRRGQPGTRFQRGSRRGGSRRVNAAFQEEEEEADEEQEASEEQQEGDYDYEEEAAEEGGEEDYFACAMTYPKNGHRAGF